MIVEFIVVVMLGAATAVTLTRMKRSGLFFGTIVGAAVVLLSSLVLLPLPENSANVAELLMIRLVFVLLFALAGAALGKWSRPQERM